MDYDRFRPDIKRADDKPEPNDYRELPVKDYSHFLDPGNAAAKPKKRRRGWIVALIILVLLAAGGGAYWLLAHHASSPKPKVATATKTTTTPASKTSTTPTVATTSYDSPNFATALNYPTGWTVVGDTASLLTIESPAMSLTASSGQTITGKIVFNIQPKGQLPSAFGSSDATAVLDSQLISYAQPTSDQRAQTYLSFVQYNATTTMGALDGIYITGDYGYQKDQNIPRADVAGLDPLVTITFGQCQGTNCANLTTTNIASSSWNNASFSAPILTLLKSLAFS